ncbi:hypothetical protein [Lacimicrobium alkaliphilum]|uniref:Pullulanase n=1 Tax=Lacimicrobium alkaliphilum TaxID=1526571 RepID=A0ABQ1RJE4_9ALTE|nr:hypothetical protein [Lacimicrobium alkaliphilum]GGD71902.1 hypothetical protein GCM10011357_28650 [Lacimicrobium alkaliphilum]
MNNLCRKTVQLFLLFLVTACSSLPQVIAPADPPDELYLRGVFNWWEAEEAYKLYKVSERLYTAEIELIADGQPYDFRIADADWSKGANCGYAEKETDEVVRLNRSVDADCYAINNNFKFTPKETGIYQFFIDFNDVQSPTVRIRRKK